MTLKRGKKIENVWKVDCLNDSEKRPANNAPPICIDGKHILDILEKQKLALAEMEQQKKEQLSNTNVKISSE